ncbi:polyamine ABC transporter substrate-binding protein [Scytonema hofmannii PCC 7110]|uniref:Polyamine ABC transporter substrate-binding protein n=1 Tax=Scytonema hofmannii PCC 7110 TaxID=128403 RepID=A0A139XCU7_9CYAN|nr:spermidine/putrescine ABC transporter substrate-binding protein [Scytonema hofmannii]KYC42517.1 polyamine ABC transporter substrate-binding protein [Scytonema hofmannii PCC 7110]
MTSRRGFITGIAALSGLSLAGCGWRLGNVRASATIGSRDQMYIYTWEQYTNKDLLKTFSAQTGIRVLADLYDSNEAMLSKIQAGGGSAYSVVYPSDYMVRKMVDLGLLTRLERDRIIGLDNLFPRFQNPIYDPNNRHSIPFSWGTTGFIYNTEKLKTPPDNWDYLWENKQLLSKRMTLMNDFREVMGAVLKMLGYSYNSTNENEIKQAFDTLKVLKPDVAAFTTDAWRNQIVAGDLLLAMCYSSDAVKIVKENPKLKYVIPKSGSSLWTDTVVIPKTAPNIEAAYAWINLILRPDVASEMSQSLNLSTPNRAGFEQLPKNIQNNSSLFPSEAILAKCERVAPLEQQIEALYERYWIELTSS